MNEEKIFWDATFQAVMLSYSGNGITAETGKQATRIANEALKARRKAFGETAK